jgi:hypothetical protein
MTFDEVQVYLDEHKDDAEVKAFLQVLSPVQELNSEKVGEFIKTDDGRMLVQPLIDQAVTKAVKTRDKAHEINLDSLVKQKVASEVLKMNPQEEPWQKEIRELKEANEKEKAERAKDNLKRQIVEKAAAVGVNPFFIEDYVPETIEQGELYIKRIKDYTDEVVKKNTNQLMSEGYKPKTGVETNKGKMDLSKMSQSELIKLEMEGKLDEQL